MYVSVGFSIGKELDFNAWVLNLLTNHCGLENYRHARVTEKYRSDIRYLPNVLETSAGQKNSFLLTYTLEKKNDKFMN